MQWFEITLEVNGEYHIPIYIRAKSVQHVRPDTLLIDGTYLTYDELISVEPAQYLPDSHIIDYLRSLQFEVNNELLWTLVENYFCGLVECNADLHAGKSPDTLVLRVLKGPYNPTPYILEYKRGD